MAEFVRRDRQLDILKTLPDQLLLRNNSNSNGQRREKSAPCVHCRYSFLRPNARRQEATTNSATRFVAQSPGADTTSIQFRSHLFILQWARTRTATLRKRYPSCCSSNSKMETPNQCRHYATSINVFGVLFPAVLSTPLRRVLEPFIPKESGLFRIDVLARRQYFKSADSLRNLANFWRAVLSHCWKKVTQQLCKYC